MRRFSCIAAISFLLHLRLILAVVLNIVTCIAECLQSTDQFYQKECDISSEVELEWFETESDVVLGV
jgi:hypothetical protein